QIKHMGHRIELGEIEAAALKISGVTAACCLYDSENKRIFLFYVGDLEEAALSDSLKRFLPRYMLPSVCLHLDRMPLTPNGKKDRKKLSEKYIVS
ncbi:MAG: D-alanine--poly(phosphoribitol) ligase, partial [Clostridia bacterium]|nr:D-alanine--poly(phosphoribitol) ligase [Clostridia bacterium]